MIRRPLPPHTDAAHAAITLELIRLTLGGQPGRPELEHQVVVRRDRPLRTHPRRTRRTR